MSDCGEEEEAEKRKEEGVDVATNMAKEKTGSGGGGGGPSLGGDNVQPLGTGKGAGKGTGEKDAGAGAGAGANAAPLEPMEAAKKALTAAKGEATGALFGGGDSTPLEALTALSEARRAKARGEAVLAKLRSTGTSPDPSIIAKVQRIIHIADRAIEQAVPPSSPNARWDAGPLSKLSAGFHDIYNIPGPTVRVKNGSMGPDPDPSKFDKEAKAANAAKDAKNAKDALKAAKSNVPTPTPNTPNDKKSAKPKTNDGKEAMNQGPMVKFPPATKPLSPAADEK